MGHSADIGTSLTCRTAPALPDEASPIPQQALMQLLDHIRSVLVSLLGYELQTPLSVIAVAVESLMDEPELPVMVERRMLAMALTELTQLCEAVEQFLEYNNRVWAMTREFLQTRSTPGASSSCRYLVQGMGGEIWAESAGSGQGSRVCFTLPVPSGAEALSLAE